MASVASLILAVLVIDPAFGLAQRQSSDNKADRAIVPAETTVLIELGG